MENVQIGSYRILKKLGTGGFAEVYLGEHIHLGRLAAIKVLHKKMGLTEEDFVEFKKEAQVIARLDHPHIIQVLDFGIEDDSPYLIMKYAANGTTRKNHPKGSVLALPLVVSYVNTMAHTLQYVHNQKVIHRDVKPENMLVDEHNVIFLSDFGIAAIAHSTLSVKTEAPIGTAVYMAPEQFTGKPCPASDQYALGVMVYEWLCGSPPFIGDYHQLAWQHLIERPQPLSERVPQIPVEVVQVVMKSLAKEPGERYPTVLEFAQALEGASKIFQTGPVLKTTLTCECSACGQELQVYETFCSACGALNTDENAQNTTMLAENVLPTYMSDANARTTTMAAENVLPAYNPDAKALSTQELPETSQSNSIPERIKLGIPADYDRAISAVWSPDGKFIATGLTGKRQMLNDVLIWEAFTGRKLLIFPMEEPGDIDWSPDGRYITIQSQSRLRVLDIQTGHIVYELAEVDRRGGIIWSPDGRHIVVIARSTLRVLDTQTGRIVYELAEADRRGGIIWSPDGRYIAYTETGKGENVRLVVRDPLTGYLVHNVNGFTRDNAKIQWSSDGRFIALYSSQKKVDIYDTQTGRWERATLPKGKLWYSNWSSNGKYITTTSIGKTIGKLILNLCGMLFLDGFIFLVVIFVLWVIEGIIADNVYCQGVCTYGVPPPITPIPLWVQSVVLSLIIGLIFYFVFTRDDYKPEFFLTDVLAKKEIQKRKLPVYPYRNTFELSRDGKYLMYPYVSGWFKRTVRLTVIENESLRNFTTSIPATNPENVSASVSPDGSRIAVVTEASTEIRPLQFEWFF